MTEYTFCWDCLMFGYYGYKQIKYEFNGFQEKIDAEELPQYSDFICSECESYKLVKTNSDEWNFDPETNKHIDEWLERVLVENCIGEHDSEIPTILLLLGIAGKIPLYYYTYKKYKESLRRISQRAMVKKLRQEIRDNNEEVINGIHVALSNEIIRPIVEPIVRRKFGKDLLMALL